MVMSQTAETGSIRRLVPQAGIFLNNTGDRTLIPSGSEHLFAMNSDRGSRKLRVFDSGY